MNKPAFQNSVCEGGGRSVSRENESGYRKLCVNELQYLGADFVHGDIEYFTDGPQLRELVRRRSEQHFVQLLMGVFHRPFHLREIDRFGSGKLEAELSR